MKKLGFLILAIITALACSLGTVGCKEKKLDILDYFENEVSYSLYTTDEASEYYDAEKGYGIMPISSERVKLYNDNQIMWGLTTEYGTVANQYNVFMICPKTNVYKVKLKRIEFTVKTDIDCTLQFATYCIIGLNAVGEDASYPRVECKAGEEQKVISYLNASWTKEEAEKSAGGERKKIAILLENKECGAKWDIFNLNFVLEKA